MSPMLDGTQGKKPRPPAGGRGPSRKRGVIVLSESDPALKRARGGGTRNASSAPSTSSSGRQQQEQRFEKRLFSVRAANSNAPGNRTSTSGARAPPPNRTASASGGQTTAWALEQMRRAKGDERGSATNGTGAAQGAQMKRPLGGRPVQRNRSFRSETSTHPSAPERGGPVSSYELANKRFERWDRSKKLILGGLLFNPKCLEAAGKPKALPQEFDSLRDYVSAYEPLLLDEARASLKRDWEDRCENGRLFPAKVASADLSSDHSTSARVETHFEITVEFQRDKCRDKLGVGDFVVLVDREPPKNVSAIQWVHSQLDKRERDRQRDKAKTEEDHKAEGKKNKHQGQGKQQQQQHEKTEMKESNKQQQQEEKEERKEPNKGAKRAMQLIHLQCFAGIVKKVTGFSRKNPKGPQSHQSPSYLTLEVYPKCPLHPKCGGQCSSHVSLEGIRARVETKHTWWVAACGAMITSKREYLALTNLSNTSPLLPLILKPNKAGGGDGTAISNGKTEASSPEELPPEFSGKNLKMFFQKQFNAKQYEAVCTAASHMAKAEENTNRACVDPKTAFTLVHGPPGTGKTHTIWGILNVVHLVCFQRNYYGKIADSIKQYLASCAPNGAKLPETSKGQKAASAGKLDQRQAKMLFRALISTDEKDSHRKILQELAPKPRILVCAPSNAAVDELCKRVAQAGFNDMDCKSPYKPDIVRVLGSNHQVMPGGLVTEVCASFQAERFLNKTRQDRDVERYNSKHELYKINSQISQNCTQLWKIQDSQSTGGYYAMGLDARVDSILKHLLHLHSQKEKHNTHLERLKHMERVLDKQSFTTRHGFSKEEYERARNKAKENLENSFLREAEIVFTTLSSSSRFEFEKLKLKFQVVLVDEAGQANELETLQPLQYGAKHCVLVGDPQQLPATVLSRTAEECYYGRSLLERFAKSGIQAIQLCEQFRMHPEIRLFPSKYFYNDKLVDAQTIKAYAADAARGTMYKSIVSAHGTGHLDVTEDKRMLDHPYTVFDIRGRITKSAKGSQGNKDEVRFVLEAYDYLMAKIAPTDKVSSDVSHMIPSVGVLTPYAYQKELLQGAFIEKYGRIGEKSRASNVRIDTVDSFQGKERDIIILSLVRSSGPDQKKKSKGEKAGNGASKSREKKKEEDKGECSEKNQKKNAKKKVEKDATTGSGGSEKNPKKNPKKKEKEDATTGSGGSGRGRSHGHLLGFVSDIRRMNVGITRAKQMLWIVGDTETLRRDEAWRALVEDAEERGRVRRAAEAEAAMAPKVPKAKELEDGEVRE